MPIRDKGKYNCKKCEKEFEWLYFESNRNGQVEDIPNTEQGKKLVYQYDKLGKKIFIHVNCPYCGFENSIIKDEKNET